jgi:hypothetical protein
MEGALDQNRRGCPPQGFVGGAPEEEHGRARCPRVVTAYELPVDSSILGSASLFR